MFFNSNKRAESNVGFSHLGEGASFEDKFTEHCIEILDNIGKSEGARVLSYINPDSQGRGLHFKKVLAFDGFFC